MVRKCEGTYEKRWALAFVAALTLALTMPVIPAHAATLTVTSLTDDATPGGLRKTIADAAPGDTITFQAGLTGTITLNSAIVIDKNLTIQGPATMAGLSAGMSPVIVSGGKKVRVFIVPQTAAVTISGLRIRDGVVGFGFSGGGIVNEGSLTLTNDLIEANTAADAGGGISSSGTLAVTNSIINANDADHHGAGIYNSGTLTMTSSTVEGNSTNNGPGSDGGGIYNNRGAVTVTSSTFVNNYAGSGGGIANTGSLTLANSTISTNHASNSGGGIDNEAQLIARNVTVAGNNANSASEATGGGGIFQGYGKLDIGNSVLANNSATGGTGPDLLVNAFGEVADKGNNFLGSVAGTLMMATSDLSANQITALGPLANNGGPTQTHALLPGSALVDTGSSALCADPLLGNKDQRGVTRPQGMACDIGAFELEVNAAMPTMPAMPAMPTMPMNAAMPMNPAMNPSN